VEEMQLLLLTLRESSLCMNICHLEVSMEEE